MDGRMDGQTDRFLDTLVSFRETGIWNWKLEHSLDKICYKLICDFIVEDGHVSILLLFTTVDTELK